jgi:hypothetical protein
LPAAWPWSLNSPWTGVLVLVVLGLYAAISAAFLQPYLGDAARYLRASPANVVVRRAIRKEAIETLDRLHTCGLYDRIIIVAHSLGCVISYDMLRAYFSRICNELPPVVDLGQDFADIDAAQWQPDRWASLEEKKELRQKGRRAVGRIAELTVNSPLGVPQHRS